MDVILDFLHEYIFFVFFGYVLVHNLLVAYIYGKRGIPLNNDPPSFGVEIGKNMYMHSDGDITSSPFK